MGAILMIFAAVYQLFDAMYIIYSGALRGAGDTGGAGRRDGDARAGLMVIAGGGGNRQIRPTPGASAARGSIASCLRGVILGAVHVRRASSARRGWREHRNVEGGRRRPSIPAGDEVRADGGVVAARGFISRMPQWLRCRNKQAARTVVSADEVSADFTPSCRSNAYGYVKLSASASSVASPSPPALRTFRGRVRRIRVTTTPVRPRRLARGRPAARTSRVNWSSPSATATGSSRPTRSWPKSNRPTGSRFPGPGGSQRDPCAGVSPPLFLSRPKRPTRRPLTLMTASPSASR